MSRSVLSNQEFSELVAFVSDALLDPRAKPDRLRRLAPHATPSGRPLLTFEFPESTP